MLPIEVFTDKNFISICDILALTDPDLKAIILQYGYPPMWKRTASFETLVHIILEQQVSLAAALAALNQLKERIKEITPHNLLQLSNENMKDCYFSRQKIIYSKHLAAELLNGNLNLEALNNKDNDTVRYTLKKIKGIGNWSVDVYLMMVLHRTDLFPFGDVALMTSIRETKKLPKEATREEIAVIARSWSPYQTIAAYLLWHAYLCKRNR